MIINLPGWWWQVVLGVQLIMIMAIVFGLISGFILNGYDSICAVSLVTTVLAFAFLSIDSMMVPSNYFEVKYRDEINANIDNGYICKINDTIINSEQAKEIVEQIYLMNDYEIYTNDSDRIIVLHKKGIEKDFDFSKNIEKYRNRLDLSITEILEVKLHLKRQVNIYHLIGITLFIIGWVIVYKWYKRGIDDCDNIKVPIYLAIGTITLIISSFILLEGNIKLNL